MRFTLSPTPSSGVILDKVCFHSKIFSVFSNSNLYLRWSSANQHEAFAVTAVMS